jgi:hypothetical protein
MGISNSKLLKYNSPQYKSYGYVSSPVPDEIKSLTIAYEPINIFKLLGFDDDTVTPAEFSARVEERLKLLTVKKGGAVDSAKKQTIKTWLDNTITSAKFSNISQQDIDTFLNTNSDITRDILQQAVNELKSDAQYRSINIKPSQQSGPVLSAQCKQVQDWIYTVDDLSAITPAEITKLGLTKTAVDLCMPKVAPGVKYSFKKDSSSVENTNLCKTLLEEAATLVTYQGSKKFDVYTKHLRQRIANRENLSPKDPVPESAFVKTCVQINKTSIASYGFSPDQIGFMILRESIDPYNFINLDIDATKDDIITRIAALKGLLADKQKKEKKSVKDLKTTCSNGLDQLEKIINSANGDVNLKNYITNRRKDTKLFPQEKLDDAKFLEYCTDSVKVNPEPEPTPAPDCKDKVKEWFDNLINSGKASATLDDIKTIKEQGVTDSDIDTCYNSSTDANGKYYNFTIGLPSKPWPILGGRRRTYRKKVKKSKRKTTRKHNG